MCPRLQPKSFFCMFSFSALLLEGIGSMNREDVDVEVPLHNNVLLFGFSSYSGSDAQQALVSYDFGFGLIVDNWKMHKDSEKVL